ncbi:hypothetical protein PMG11_11085 [Penicillium brasilianum]|uniref:BED-type domain-containing protein n=1 Tax=Penicillium brasilianum TaxID=104259 RepID=A0A0F7U155_PENBI|nr:hypothetical protein PMG11_11085 [Penicillium brasilianum]
MTHSDWVDWWLQTDYGRKSKIHWDSSHQSDIWSHFHQVAHGTDGSPKVMCKRCGQILEHPYSLSKGADGKDQRHGLSTMKRHLTTAGCQKANKGHNAEITEFLKKGDDTPTEATFSQEGWEEEILSFLSMNRLPFHLIEHPTFKSLINMARSALSPPIIPSAMTIRRRLESLVRDRQQRILRMLPAGCKLSIALDCWTSPFSQAFMAITGYFIDADWVYREVLLDFKPIYGAHTGANLSSVLVETLVKHRIEDRVFGLTTDNASNNKTLVDSLQQALSDGVLIIRIPCLAHIIQLSLNQLLGHIKAVPLNDTAGTKWTEQQSLMAQVNAQHRKREIFYTLNKIRYLAIYVNASSQRRETFSNLQTKDTKLMPIQDVKTRWNSTFLMLRRAKRLCAIFTPFCVEYDREDLLLNNEEWRQVDYLLCITKPFFDYTTQLSKTRDIAAHYVFRVYNKLFEHLEQSMKQLRRKRVPWKKHMLDALEAGRLKLDEYYSQTDNVRGHIYAVNTMLAPVNKFQFFLTDDWDQKWRDTYRKSFQEALAPYQDRLSNTQGSQVSEVAVRPSSKLDKMLNGSKKQPKAAADEMTQYLDSDTIDIGALAFWRENQCRFPAIAALARDVLSVPATGAGVERLFNTARDICHYRRGRMKSETIQELMMFLCTSRFDLEEKESHRLEKFFSREEIEAAKEEKDERIDEVEVEPISDTEESNNELNNEIVAEVAPSSTIQDHTEPELPENNTQLRASGRKRKSREDDAFEYH